MVINIIPAIVTDRLLLMCVPPLIDGIVCIHCSVAVGWWWWLRTTIYRSIDTILSVANRSFDLTRGNSCRSLAGRTLVVLLLFLLRILIAPWIGASKAVGYCSCLRAFAICLPIDVCTPSLHLEQLGCGAMWLVVPYKSSEQPKKLGGGWVGGRVAYWGRRQDGADPSLLDCGVRALLLQFQSAII